MLNLYRCAIAVALLLAGGGCAFAASPADDFVHVVRSGDTVIGLSERLLKEPVQWRQVAQYNRMPNPNLIRPAQAIRIPLELLRSAPGMATVASATGDVKISGGATAATPAPIAVAALGATLAEGAEVITGKNGYATLKLADGSIVRVQADSQVQISRLRSYPDTGILESVFHVVVGRVESLVAKIGGAGSQPRSSVQTRLGTMGVRGTEFRVTMDSKAEQARSEVLEGVVAVAAAGATGEGKRVNAGFGSVVDSSKSVADPVALLAAPQTARLPALLERTVLRFPLTALDGARAYRAQVARDKEFNVVVAEALMTSPELRFTEIADGSYFLRVRGVDARGLEGRDATHAFRLKARPEPPLISVPVAKGKVRSKDVEFKWADNPEAASYHIQVARDAAFKSLAHENKSVKGTEATVASLPLGDYFWRVASLRKDGDRGPYGDVASFALMAPPAQPEPPSVGDNGVQFRWAGESGQKFEFQLADNPQFAKPLLTHSLDKPAFEVPRPGPGTYYMRFRATDPDGFVGPYSSVQRFSVQPCVTDSSGRCLASSFGMVGPSQ